MSTSPYALAVTSQGWDLLWTSPQGRMFFSRFDPNGRRLAPDLQLRGAPQYPTLAHTDGMDVAAWREDRGNGSQLQAAILRPGRSPVYRVLAQGQASLEHPQAFPAKRGVDIVFSWQRSRAYNLFLTGISSSGAARPPNQLTSVSEYAFNPQGVLDAQGRLHLLYMDLRRHSTRYVVQDLYSSDGRRLGPTRTLDSIDGLQDLTPEHWPLTIQRAGASVWGAWAGSQGLMVASWRGSALSVPPTAPEPIASTLWLVLVVSGDRRELVWQSQGNTGNILSTVQLGSQGQAEGAPDRLNYENASASQPEAVSENGEPGVLWQSAAGSGTARLELSRFTPDTRSAPTLWDRLGLGVANPVATLALVLAGGIGIGILATMANFLVVLALVLLYMVLARVVPSDRKWYLYPVVLAAALFLLLGVMGAPSPPIFVLGALPGGALGLLALVASAVFVYILSRAYLYRIEDLFRAALMAFVAVYFVAFLHALTLIQDQVSRV